MKASMHCTKATEMEAPESYKQWIQHLLKTKEITKKDVKLLLEDYRQKVAILSRPKQHYRYARP